MFFGHLFMISNIKVLWFITDYVKTSPEGKSSIAGGFNHRLYAHIDYEHKPGQFREPLVPRLCLGMRSQRLRLDFWVHADMRVVWRLTFTKWKAEPSGMHSHAEHGNEEALAILSALCS